MSKHAAASRSNGGQTSVGTSADAGRGGPDFLCIGAPKCGTTWLYKQLATHSGIWLPPIKELHYFDRRFPFPSVFNFPSQPMGLAGLWANQSRRVVLRALSQSMRPMYGCNPLWALRYLSAGHDDAWYRSLFSPAGERLAGDLTTAYCALSAEAVAHIEQSYPQVKVLYLMRDPVQRAWSHAKMVLPLILDKPLEQVSEADYAAYLQRPEPQLHGDYCRTLAVWEQALPAERLHIDFYDRLSSAPATMLKDIWRFLGVTAPAPLSEQRLGERVNASRRASGGDIPPAIGAQLARHYLPDLELLAARFGEPVSEWLALARARVA